MKTRFRIFAAFAFPLVGFLCASTTCVAQAAHSVTLTWTASSDSTPGTPESVTVYKAEGQCPADGVQVTNFGVVATNQPASGSFQDASVLGGHTYCYFTTTTVGGIVSPPSNATQVTVGVRAPTLAATAE